MKDKEKQIEEMAKTYCQNPYSCYGYNCLVNSPCTVLEACKELYEQGYRKLPEDSVVLSKEEYEKLTKELVTEQRAKEIAQEYFGIVRKETAEKCYQLFKENCCAKGIDWVKNELAKQFEVEIKE